MASLPPDPFARSALPDRVIAEGRDEAGRQQRIQWIGRAAEALLDGQMPAPDARLFVAGAILSWLTNGGNLERDHFRVVRPKSHATPAAIWRQAKSSHRDDDALR